MDHVVKKKDGTFDLKLLPECNLPLTGVGVVDMIVTDLGVVEVTDDGLRLTELAPGVTVEEVQEKTAAKLDVSAVATNACSGLASRGIISMRTCPTENGG